MTKLKEFGKKIERETKRIVHQAEDVTPKAVPFLDMQTRLAALEIAQQVAVPIMLGAPAVPVILTALAAPVVHTAPLGGSARKPSV